MSRLTLTAVGGEISETVLLDDSPVGGPGPDEILVAIEAAPVNNADLLFAAGWFAVQPNVPSLLGAEGVGRVQQVGSAVDQTLIGRRVLLLPTFRHGTWADRAIVPAASTVPLPEAGDTLQLAMLAVNPATAYALLHDFVPLRPGDWIGLNLANSAVGQYLIALAKRAGVRTLAVVRSSEAADQIRKLEPDRVVVDGDGLGDRVAHALGGSRLRLLLEGTSDPAQIGELVRSVEDGGSVVVFAAATGQSPALPLGDAIYRGISLRAFFILNWIRDTPRERLDQTYAELADLVIRGALSAAVEATYPLSEFRAALAHAQRAGRHGKILFTPRPSAL